MSTKHLDRLLPRHEAANSVSLSWNIRLERAGLLKKEEVSTPAVIRDLSLEGALIEVQTNDNIKPGTRVQVRFHDLDGIAEVKHARVGEDGSTLYGVKFFPERDFRDAIDSVVGVLRGHSAELTAAWQRHN